MLLLEETQHPFRLGLDQDVALERGPHLLHITLLGNPLRHSAGREDLRQRKKMVLKSALVLKADIFAMWILAVVDCSTQSIIMSVC